MNKIKNIFVLMILISAFTMLFSFPVLSLELDSGDVLTIKQPSPDSTIRDSIRVDYVVFDDDKSVVPTSLEIWNAQCNSKQRTIFSANLASKNSISSASWNTKGSYRDGSALPDGQYCLRICSDLLNGTQEYSACNQRKVTLRNYTNKAPVIVSKPITSINEDQNYNYPVIAQDADRDPLVYTLKKGPEFIKLTGNRITSLGKLVPGSYEIIVEVRDNYNGKAEQKYTLIVNKNQTNEPNQNPLNDVTIDFIRPISGDQLYGSENKIVWEIGNSSKVEKLTLFKAKQIAGEEISSESWQELISYSSENIKETQEYVWNADNLDLGDYRLKLVAASGDNSVVAISDTFSIVKEDGGENIEIEYKIFDIKPFNGEKLSFRKEVEISAKISLPNDLDQLKIGDFSVKLAGEPIVDTCSISGLDGDRIQTITCKVQIDPGNYTFELSINSAGSREGLERSWNFIVLAENEGNPYQNGEQIIDVLGMQLPESVANLLYLVCGLLLCLLLLPIILLSIWRRRTRTSYQSVETTETTTTVSDPYDFSLDATDLESQPVVIEERTASTIPVPESANPPTEPAVSESGWLARQKQRVNDALASRKNNSTTTKEESFVTSNPDANDPLTPAPQATSAASQSTSTASILGDENPIANPLEPVANSNTSTTDFLMPVDGGGNNEPKNSETTLPDLDNIQQRSSDSKASTTNTTTTTSTTSANDELPDWLKDSNASSAQPMPTSGAAQTQPTTTAVDEDDEDDGADPYGFGDYSLGDPS